MRHKKTMNPDDMIQMTRLLIKGIDWIANDANLDFPKDLLDLSDIGFECWLPSDQRLIVASEEKIEETLAAFLKDQETFKLEDYGELPVEEKLRQWGKWDGQEPETTRRAEHNYGVFDPKTGKVTHEFSDDREQDQPYDRGMADVEDDGDRGLGDSVYAGFEQVDDTLPVVGGEDGEDAPE